MWDGLIDMRISFAFPRKCQILPDQHRENIQGVGLKRRVRSCCEEEDLIKEFDALLFEEVEFLEFLEERSRFFFLFFLCSFLSSFFLFVVFLSSFSFFPYDFYVTTKLLHKG